MRILFIAPQDPDVASNLKFLMGGESTYTKLLRSFNFKHIELIYFEDALKGREISLHWSYYFSLYLQKLRILPPGPRAYPFVIIGQFDGIYAHAYPVRIMSNIPTIISDSSSNEIFLRDYLNWPLWRIRIARIIKKTVFGLLKLMDGEVNTHYARTAFTFSHWAKKYKDKHVKNTQFQVLYPPVNAPAALQKQKRARIKLLFVGVWFERKGGRLVLEAFRNLRKRYQKLELTLLGEIPAYISVITDKYIRHFNFVPYKTLQKMYATHDILLHVPPKTEGYGMAVPEALSYGMNVIVSDVCALAELVNNGKAGMVIEPGSAHALEKAVAALIENHKKRKLLSLKARQWYQKQMSDRVFMRAFEKLFLA